MFRLSTQSRRATAASLLVVFLNVFFGQVLCALAMPRAAEHQHPAGTAPHHHEHESAASAHHTAGHGATAHHHEHKSPASHSHQHGPKGACCQDDAAAVWASLSHPPKAGVEQLMPFAVALPPVPFVLTLRSQQWDRTQPVLLVARRQLKPKIPDIRIFIQSLTV